jgi:hypothetical protein
MEIFSIFCDFLPPRETTNGYKLSQVKAGLLQKTMVSIIHLILNKQFSLYFQRHSVYPALLIPKLSFPTEIVQNCWGN